jgi:hypothetical protein
VSSKEGAKEDNDRNKSGRSSYPSNTYSHNDVYIDETICSDDDVQLDSLNCKNMSDRLDISKQNGMVLHHHLDRLKIIDDEVSVVQDALRPVQLDSLKSRRGDRITDCHPQTLNVDHNLI